MLLQNIKKKKHFLSLFILYVKNMAYINLLICQKQSYIGIFIKNKFIFKQL